MTISGYTHNIKLRNFPNFNLKYSYRRITSKKCDKRINLLTEVLNGIKIGIFQ